MKIIFCPVQRWSPHLENDEQKERLLLKEEGHSAKSIIDDFGNIQAKNSIKTLYDDWESYYRPKLEELLGKPIQSDIWGDLGLIRQSITHRRSLGFEKLKNAKIITDFKPGEKISLTPAVMEKIKQALDQWYNDFLMENFSPKGCK